MTYFIIRVYDIIQHCYIKTYIMVLVNDIMKMRQHCTQVQTGL